MLLLCKVYTKNTIDYFCRTEAFVYASYWLYNVYRKRDALVV